MARLKARFQPALIEYEPYVDHLDPDWPSFAPFSMLGQCPTHGLERVTRESTGPGPDPTRLFHFQCGEVDPLSFG